MVIEVMQKITLVTLIEMRKLRNEMEPPMTDINEIVGEHACPCFGCQCEPNQVTKDAIEEARNRNDTR